MNIITRDEYITNSKLSEAYMERGIDVNFGITPSDVIERALNLLNVNANSFVLDIGCGDGRALKLARDRDARVLGIECSRLRYQLAQQLLSSFSSNVSVIHGDYRDVIIPAGVTHLFSFLWPSVTEQVIQHVQKYVRTFHGVSVIHPLPGEFERIPLSEKHPKTWFGYLYYSDTSITHTLRPLKLEIVAQPRCPGCLSPNCKSCRGKSPKKATSQKFCGNCATKPSSCKRHNSVGNDSLRKRKLPARRRAKLVVWPDLAI